MIDRTMFANEIQQQIETLGASTVRLSLMSVRAPALPSAVFESALHAAAAPLDVVGRLDDGSLGMLSLRSVGTDGGAGVEHRFLLKMQAVLAQVASRRAIGPICYRAVHRWACELTDALDLLDCLFDAPLRVLTPPQPQLSSLIPAWYHPTGSVPLQLSRYAPAPGSSRYA